MTKMNDPAALTAEEAHLQFQKLERPLKERRGISAARLGLFKKLDVYTDLDLLRLFPHSYEDWTTLSPLADLHDGAEQVFLAKVSRLPQLHYKGRMSVLRTTLRDASGVITGVWFNQPYHQKNLVKERVYLFRGKVKVDAHGTSVINPTFEATSLPADVEIRPESYSETFLKPVYPLTAKLTQGVVRSLIDQALADHLGHIPEVLPQIIRRRWKLATTNFAYENIHHPEDREDFLLARKRLVFEELFMVQLGLRRMREHDSARFTAPSLALDKAQTEAFQKLKAGLPFALTDAQERVLSEITADLETTVPMSRLVQGDVGSGKTIVASLSLLRCCLAGCQGAMMAPTGVLAVQHFHNISAQLEGSGLKIALLTGQTTPANKRKIVAATASGEVDILIGTHALLEDKVVFRRLGLTVTDEQHRFGVRQRVRLATDDAHAPHVMVMSATPIPRTLGLILYGDLDISSIDQLPAGRKPILTYTARPADRERVWDLARREMDAGRQVYVICPLVKEEEGTPSDLASAEATYQDLSENVFPDYKVGLVYGAMKEKEKQTVMKGFIDGEVQILVSTTVVEVGVDNPNATFMVIENAERFGLSQLHQLRGRIGRGGERSICVLMSDVSESLARERMRTLCHTTDGFAIAEADLKLRGPGDFFGTRQHGLPEFRIANLYQDQDILAMSKEAVDWLQSHPGELSPAEEMYLQIGLEKSLGVSPDIPGI